MEYINLSFFLAFNLLGVGHLRQLEELPEGLGAVLGTLSAVHLVEVLVVDEAQQHGVTGHAEHGHEEHRDGVGNHEHDLAHLACISLLCTAGWGRTASRSRCPRW